MLFRADRSTSLVHSQFVRGVFAQAGTNVALLIGRAPLAGSEQTHLFLPFFGGPDDRLALDFVVQLCANPRVRATVLRVTKRVVDANVSAPEAAHIAGDDDKDEENARVNAATITSLRSVRTFCFAPQNEEKAFRVSSPVADDGIRSRPASRTRCTVTQRRRRGCSPRLPTALRGHDTRLRARKTEGRATWEAARSARRCRA